MRARLAGAVIVMLTTGPILADSPVTPYPYIEPIPETRYYFKMIPGPTPWDTSSAKGGLYKITDGEDELVWATRGWYSFTVFLARDREHLVRMGLWSMGRTPSTNDLAVAFYRSGKLIKSYTTLDLVPERNDVRVSISHYEWLQKIVGLTECDPENAFAPLERPEYPLTFTLTTTANETLTFDVKSGRILAREKKRLEEGIQQSPSGDVLKAAPKE